MQVRPVKVLFFRHISRPQIFLLNSATTYVCTVALNNLVARMSKDVISPILFCMLACDTWVIEPYLFHMIVVRALTDLLTSRADSKNHPLLHTCHRTFARIL